MSGRDEEHDRPRGSRAGIRHEPHDRSFGIGPPGSFSVPASETFTGTPERTSTGDTERAYFGDRAGAPGRSRPWPPSESETSPLGWHWLLLPRQLAAHEQQLLKEELARLARDGDMAVAVAAGAAPGEVCFVLPVRTDQLSAAAQAIVRRRAPGRSAAAAAFQTSHTT